MMQAVNKGFTIIEALTALGVVAILAAISTPFFANMLHKHRLQSAAQKLSEFILTARTESVKKQASIYMLSQTSNSGGAWDVALSDTADCSLGTSGTCQIDGQQFQMNASEYSNMTLQLAGFTLNSNNQADIEFSGERGLASQVGTFTFSLSGQSLQLSVDRLGHIRQCSNTLGGYPACT